MICGTFPRSPFESSVISYGNQTHGCTHGRDELFESSVISYGNQTARILLFSCRVFESSVISYGNQTTFLQNQLDYEFESSWSYVKI